jgi:hypothetical protein
LFFSVSFSFFFLFFILFLVGLFCFGRRGGFLCLRLFGCGCGRRSACRSGFSLSLLASVVSAWFLRVSVRSCRLVLLFVVVGVLAHSCLFWFCEGSPKWERNQNFGFWDAPEPPPRQTGERDDKTERRHEGTKPKPPKQATTTRNPTDTQTDDHNHNRTAASKGTHRDGRNKTNQPKTKQNKNQNKNKTKQKHIQNKNKTKDV